MCIWVLEIQILSWHFHPYQVKFIISAEYILFMTFHNKTFPLCLMAAVTQPCICCDIGSYRSRYLFAILQTEGSKLCLSGKQSANGNIKVIYLIVNANSKWLIKHKIWFHRLNSLLLSHISHEHAQSHFLACNRLAYSVARWLFLALTVIRFHRVDVIINYTIRNSKLLLPWRRTTNCRAK